MRYHPPIYYTIRTCVRFVFYTSIALLLILAFAELADDDRPECDVITHDNFTWEWNQTPVDLDSCIHPWLTILNPDGTYEWEQEQP